MKIGHASIDENGNIKNGKAGNQSDKELCIREWYNKSWDYVLRCKNQVIADKIAEACIKGCNNKNIGYNQLKRNTLYYEAKKNNFDLSKVGLCECDCSSFVTVCVISAGINLNYGTNAPTTSTLKNVLYSTGLFEVLLDTKYTNSPDYLKKGDIIIKAGHHVVIALENSSNFLYGIDISHWQGNIQWNKLALNKFDFLILKLSQYKTKDNMFDIYYPEASKICKVGAYVYNKVLNVAQAKEEATFAVKALNGKSLSAWIWLDLEDKSMKNLGKQLLNEIIITEANIFKSAGYNVGIYCNVDWYKNILDTSYLSKMFKFWIARYPANDNGMLKENLSPKTYASIWQYSSKGTVPGINGHVDMNIAYENFFLKTHSQTFIPIEKSKVELSDYWIGTGQLHSINFTGVNIPISKQWDSITKKQAARVLQKAINLDYKKNLLIDGIFGTKSIEALGNHYTKINEKQYMVTALVILLSLHGYPIPLKANPDIYTSLTQNIVKEYQKTNGLNVTGIADSSTYKSLLK